MLVHAQTSRQNIPKQMGPFPDPRGRPKNGREPNLILAWVSYTELRCSVFYYFPLHPLLIFPILASVPSCSEQPESRREWRFHLVNPRQGRRDRQLEISAGEGERVVTTENGQEEGDNPLAGGG